ncbi:syndecan-like [Macrobrachium nipponense]|uniref:syndecan-like n=1 Tax=Macrobrachium nipponense TaxID=159736 RepID=UPI0030C87F73
MRIYFAIGCVVLLGPLSQHKALGDIYANNGGTDLYWDDNENGDYGSGEGPETDAPYPDHEGSGHGKVMVGPYGADYDNYIDSEDGDDIIDGGDDRGRDEDPGPIEGSGVGGTLFIDEEEDFDRVDEKEELFEPEFDVHEVESVDKVPKLESVPNTTPPPTLTDESDMDSSIQIHTTKTDDRQVSIFAQPGILAAFIGGAVVGLLCAILLVMFIVYRMRKKDEGSYPLDEPKRMPLTSSYSPNDKEIYA